MEMSNIRRCTWLIIKRGPEYLVGRILGTNDLKWSTSPWDAWRTRDREEAEDFAGWQKVWCLLLCAGCVFCIMLALTLGWTPLSSDVILGIQGRYFLPLLPVLIPVIRDRHIRVDTGLRRRMVFLTTAVNLWLLVHAYSQMFFTA